MKVGRNVYQHILNIFFERATPIYHVTADVSIFLVKTFFLQNPKYYIPLETYLNADSKNGPPHIKKSFHQKLQPF